MTYSSYFFFFDLVFCIAIWTYWFVVYQSISQRRNIQTYFLKNLFSGGKQQTFYFILLSITFMHISNNNFHSVFLLNWYNINDICRFPYLLPCLLISIFALGVAVLSCWLPVYMLLHHNLQPFIIFLRIFCFIFYFFQSPVS